MTLSNILQTNNECPTCKGKRYICKDKESNIWSKCPMCNEGAIGNEIIERSGIPNGNQNKRITDIDWSLYVLNGKKIDTEKEEKMIDRFIENYPEIKTFGMGLYLTSDTRGSGKTFIASCVGCSLADIHHANVKFINESELINEAQKKEQVSAYASRYDDDRILLYCECDVLILDDVGQSYNANKWVSQIINRIVNQRREHDLMTIYTSNYTIDDLPFDTNIKSRIQEKVFTIHIPEVSIRMQVGNENKRQILSKMGF